MVIFDVGDVLQDSTGNSTGDTTGGTTGDSTGDSTGDKERKQNEETLKMSRRSAAVERKRSCREEAQL